MMLSTCTNGALPKADIIRLIWSMVRSSRIRRSNVEVEFPRNAEHQLMLRIINAAMPEISKPVPLRRRASSLPIRCMIPAYRSAQTASCWEISAATDVSVFGGMINHLGYLALSAVNWGQQGRVFHLRRLYRIAPATRLIIANFNLALNRAVVFPHDYSFSGSITDSV